MLHKLQDESGRRHTTNAAIDLNIIDKELQQRDHDHEVLRGRVQIMRGQAYLALEDVPGRGVLSYSCQEVG